MLELLNGFVIELRNSGIPVSLTENLDAMEAVKHIPLEDREAFKYALAATMVKNQSHWKAFETVFEIYFSLRGEEYDLDEDGKPDDSTTGRHVRRRRRGRWRATAASAADGAAAHRCRPRRSPRCSTRRWPRATGSSCGWWPATR